MAADDLDVAALVSLLANLSADERKVVTLAIEDIAVELPAVPQEKRVVYTSFMSLRWPRARRLRVAPASRRRLAPRPRGVAGRRLRRSSRAGPARPDNEPSPLASRSLVWGRR